MKDFTPTSVAFDLRRRAVTNQLREQAKQNGTLVPDEQLVACAIEITNHESALCNAWTKATGVVKRRALRITLTHEIADTLDAYLDSPDEDRHNGNDALRLVAVGRAVSNLYTRANDLSTASNAVDYEALARDEDVTVTGNVDPWDDMRCRSQVPMSNGARCALFNGHKEEHRVENARSTSLRATRDARAAGQTHVACEVGHGGSPCPDPRCWQIICTCGSTSGHDTDHTPCCAIEVAAELRRHDASCVDCEQGKRTT